MSVRPVCLRPSVRLRPSGAGHRPSVRMPRAHPSRTRVGDVGAPTPPAWAERRRPLAEARHAAGHAQPPPGPRPPCLSDSATTAWLASGSAVSAAFGSLSAAAAAAPRPLEARRPPQQRSPQPPACPPAAASAPPRGFHRTPAAIMVS